MKAIFYIFLLTLFCACSERTPREHSSELPPIFPDYTNVTIPPNIAPLNFGIRGAEYIRVTISYADKTLMELSGDEYIRISAKAWRKMLDTHKGKALTVNVAAWTKEHPDGLQYNSFTIHIAEETIDGYVAYRLIPPGYIGWNKMAIMQRDLSNFDETPIITNNENEGGCLNCHNFCQGNPDRYMLHARNKGGGTVIVKDGKMEKKDISIHAHNATYPNWHPDGRFIAFSVNDVHQSFYSHCVSKIEVFDNFSDLIIYDTKTDRIIEDLRFADTLQMETFPAFSPDGKYLYFCSSPTHILPFDVDSMAYSILRVPFDVKTGRTGTPVDTVYNAHIQGGSASHPRISPDGQYLLFAWAESGTFPIQHPESELMMIDLKTNKLYKPDNINAQGADSYHNWSSNGKWVVFASRRIEGRTTNLFFSYFANGQFCKPFMLPQKDPEQNVQRFFSYNVPEFIKGKVDVDRDAMSVMLQSKK